MGEILSEEYNEGLIEKAFKEFSCRRETDLENFLMRKAIPYERTNYGKTHLLVDSDKLEKEGKFVVAAYFTIAQNSVNISALPKKKKRKMLGEYPGRDALETIPSYLIGQLGRNDLYSGEELSGQQILDECYHALSVAARVVGGNLLIVECRECMYDKFYAKKGFKKLYDELNEEGLYTLYQRINFSEYLNRY